jgi:hypothetical protein
MKQQQKPAPAPAVNPRLERERPSEFRTFYTNNAQVITTYFDIGILFGELLDANEQRILIKDLALVKMSPEHAKSLNRVLTQQLEIYENRFGPIRAELKIDS